MSQVRCHCCSVFAIALWNSNSVTDDDFDVKLNGHSIGAINGNQDAVTGRIFALSTDFTPAKFGPAPTNVMESTLLLDESFLVTGVNALHVDITHVNGFGDLGSVRVGYWRLDELTAGKYDLHGAALLDSYYGNFDSRFDWTFNYP